MSVTGRTGKSEKTGRPQTLFSGPLGQPRDVLLQWTPRKSDSVTAARGNADEISGQKGTLQKNTSTRVPFP